VLSSALFAWRESSRECRSTFETANVCGGFPSTKYRYRDNMRVFTKEEAVAGKVSNQAVKISCQHRTTLAAGMKEHLHRSLAEISP